MKEKLPKITDWPAFLAAWGEKAREPRREGAPKVVSTFAGCGGSSTGYRMAGFDVVLATDWWETAGETYRLNWPGCPYFVADVTKMDGKDVLRETGLGEGELDLLDGSPPCQGFSTAGKRMLDDPRNSLFLDFCRLLEGIQPKAFVMENVSGIVFGKMRVLFREMTSKLKTCGYNVRCRMLDASWLGVPQTRRRMIWIGARDDLGVEPTHPVPSYRRPSVADAFSDIFDIEFHASPFTRREWESILERKEETGKKVKVRSSNEPCQTVPALRPPILAISMDGRIADGDPAMDHSDYNRLKTRTAFNRDWVDVREPSGSLTGFRPPVGNDILTRIMTVGECKRVQSFPDWYEFSGKIDDGYKQLGNAVPPLMAAHVALAMSEELFGFSAVYAGTDLFDHG